MSDATISKLTLDSLRAILQQAGYRAETVTDPVADHALLRSATGGAAFDIRPGNRLAGEEQAFTDAAFILVLQLGCEIPPDAVNHWNATRRFARLQSNQSLLVFCMDVNVIGGVMPAHLRAQIEIWDSLVQEVLAYLRIQLSDLVVEDVAQKKSAIGQPQAERVFAT
jgi:hypothetical protein